MAVRIHFSFLVFNALIFLLRDSRLLLAFYTVCAIHEAGHIAALSLAGGHIRSVELSGAGIRMDVRRSGMLPIRSSLFVLIAGPAVNILMYCILRFAGIGGIFLTLNLMAAAYNMLPYRSLDGGAILALFTEGAPCEGAAETVMAAVKLFFIAFSAAALIVWGKAAVPLLIASIALYIGDRTSK